MRVLRYPAALVVVLALVSVTAWALSWPFEKAVYLAPVIVVAGAAAIGLVLLWSKVALNSLRESRLRHESPAIANRLSPPARRRNRFRPPAPVAWLHMHQGTWTLADCPPDAQSELVRELGISELTAAVLVRRGYSDPVVARRF